MKKPNIFIAFAIAGIALASCKDSTFAPTSSPNPRPDDYSALCTMDDYRSWGTYNVHDPAVCRVGKTYYMVSTDAIYLKPREKGANDSISRKSREPKGYLQIRKSDNLVDWDFVGWAFDSIPGEAVEWVRSANNGRGAYNIWAPYLVDCGDGRFHLYYCVSAFGKNTSYIGLAEASNPEGPWTTKGYVVRTDKNSVMNAIDPSVIVTADGRRLMHYGSYFGGIFCLELDNATGLAKTEGDQGKLVARRANYRRDNLEAPEIIRNHADGKYYLFGSYDPLMTTYNVRVGRSDSPDGPFIDFNGKEMSDTTDNLPLLTAPYRFSNHPGWVGTAHCGVFSDDKGNYFMAHQGRLASNPDLMVLNLRQLFFTPDGWPVVSPERYAGTPSRKFSSRDLIGEWEMVRLREPVADPNLEAGQVVGRRNNLFGDGWNVATPFTIASDGSMDADKRWEFNPEKQLLRIESDDETIENLIVFAGHDWELEQETVLFTGLDSEGRAVWGKRVR